MENTEEVELLVRHGSTVYPIPVQRSHTVSELKTTLYEKTGVPPERQKLLGLRRCKGAGRVSSAAPVDDETLDKFELKSRTRVLMLGTAHGEEVRPPPAGETDQEVVNDLDVVEIPAPPEAPPPRFRYHPTRVPWPPPPTRFRDNGMENHRAHLPPSREQLYDLLTSACLDPSVFASQFEARFMRAHPGLYTGSFEEALQDARQRYRVLLLFLHSESTPESSLFCTDVLTNPVVVDAILDSFVLLGTEAVEEDRIRQVLHLSNFPAFYAITFVGGVTSVVDVFEGFMTVDELLARLTQVVATHGLMLDEARKREQVSASVLIAEQDEAYQVALQEDLEKDREEQREADRQRTEEEERIDAEARQLQAREEQIQRAKHPKERRARLQSLPEEPPVDTLGIIRLMIRLPDGHRLHRRFDKMALVGNVEDFLLSQVDTFPLDQYRLVTSFPRRVLDDREQTLCEAGIEDRVVLLLELR